MSWCIYGDEQPLKVKQTAATLKADKSNKANRKNKNSVSRLN
ncbi:MAG TPA: hypothetical protein VFV46_08845 [Lacibacter sp.]|nr:hypothetical protein [Lacibacter sp.]